MMLILSSLWAVENLLALSVPHLFFILHRDGQHFSTFTILFRVEALQSHSNTIPYIILAQVYVQVKLMG